MSIAKRTFGVAPTLRDAMTRGKDFTDAAIDLDIDEVLSHAKRKTKIAHSAAKLSGVHLQLEGDYDSQKLVYAAYDGIYDMMRPALESRGADETLQLFNQPTTRHTILDLSRTLDSAGFSKVAHHYATRGDYLQLSDDGLEKQPDYSVDKQYETRKGGCPYARGEDARYFNQVTDRIIETYVHAHDSGMPHGWLDVINRSLLRR